MKKILCASIALLMLFACVSCMKNEEKPSVNSAPTDIDDSLSGVPSDVDFEGKAVNLWYTTNCVAGESKYDLNPEDLVEKVNADIVAASTATETRLNVKINYYNSGVLTSEAGNEIRKHVFAGQSEYDIYQLVEWCSSELAVEGIYLNLNGMPYLSLDSEWWDGEYMKEMNIGDKMFLLVGDFSVDRTRNLSCVFYNKTKYEYLYQNKDGMYDLVKNRQWTIDKMIELCKDAYVDENSNTVVDLDDELGMILNKDNILDGFYYGAGLKVTARDESDLPIFDVVNLNSIDLCEKIMSMVGGKEQGIYTIPTQYDHESNLDRQKRFGSGQVLLSPGFIYHSEEIVKYETQYGIVPYPLANEEQENYHSIVHNILSEMALPSTCNDPEMACAVLEELSYQGYKRVLPTYYEKMLKFRYAQDPQSAEMIDIIRDGCVTDIALIYPTVFNRIGIVLRVMAQEGKTNLQAVYDERIQAANEKTSTFISRYQALS